MLMGAKMCEGCGEKRASFPNGLEGIDDREAPMVRRLRQAPWGRAAGEAHGARKDTREQRTATRRMTRWRTMATLARSPLSFTDCR